MKKILITGANSYIGTSFERWVEKFNGKYFVESVDVQKDSWKKKDFSGYDVVFHVAAIVHVKEKNIEKYFKVNTDLAIQVAEKAKTEGVRQFIFLSTMAVYGMEVGYITKHTMPNPKTPYGKSKLEAEENLLKLNDENFKVVILRPPMVYGKGCKGNYQRLAKAALRLPIFPDIDNKRSMLHIDNLCEFVRLMIDNEESGIFFPQNKEYIKTSEMVKLIAEVHGKKIRLTKVFNPILKLLSYKVGIINKVFGNLVYEKSMSEYKENYVVRDFRESIITTES